MAHGKYVSRFHVVAWSSRQKAIDAMYARGAIIQKVYDTFYFVDFDDHLGNGVMAYSCNITTNKVNVVVGDQIVGDVWKITGSYYDDDRIMLLIPFERRTEYRKPKKCV